MFSKKEERSLGGGGASMRGSGAIDEMFRGARREWLSLSIDAERAVGGGRKRDGKKGSIWRRFAEFTAHYFLRRLCALGKNNLSLRTEVAKGGERRKGVKKK